MSNDKGGGEVPGGEGCRSIQNVLPCRFLLSLNVNLLLPPCPQYHITTYFDNTCPGVPVSMQASDWTRSILKYGNESWGKPYTFA